MQAKKRKRKKNGSPYAMKILKFGVPAAYSAEYRMWKARVLKRDDATLEHYAWKKKHGPDNWRRQ